MSREQQLARDIADIAKGALRAQGWKDGGEVVELVARLRAAEQVVEAARAVHTMHHGSFGPVSVAQWMALTDALKAFDAAAIP